MKACTLAREHLLGRLRLPAGTRIHFSEGEPASFTLGAVATIAGFELPPDTEVKFHDKLAQRPGGRPKEAKLARSATIRGIDFPANTTIYFFSIFTQGDHPGCYRVCLPTPMLIQGHLCAPGGNPPAQIFYASGKLMGISLMEDEEIEGVPCTTKKTGMPFKIRFYGFDTNVWFFETGRLQQAMVSRDCTVQGHVFKRGDIVRFNADGTLDTSGKPLGYGRRDWSKQFFGGPPAKASSVKGTHGPP